MVGKKRDFFNMSIYTYGSLRSIGHIMVGKPTKLSTDTTVIEFIVTNHHSQPYMRRGVSWRCIVDGMGYEFLKHAQPSYLEMNLPTYLLNLNEKTIKCKGD